MDADHTGRSYIGMDVSRYGDGGVISFAFNDHTGSLRILDVVEIGIACAAKGCVVSLPQIGTHRLFCGSHWARLPGWLRATLRGRYWETRHLVLARNIVGALEAGNLYGAALDLVRHYREIDDRTLMDDLGLSRRQAFTIIDQLVAAGVVTTDTEDELGRHVLAVPKDCGGT